MTCWIFMLKTSLPYPCFNHANLPTEYYVFSDFSEARAALRHRLQTLAFSRNALFDGQGQMPRFAAYIHTHGQEDVTEPYEEFRDNGWLTQGRMQALSDALAAVLSGEDVDVPLESGDYIDNFLCLTVTEKHVNLNGLDETVGSVYAPVIRTNMFNMTQEGNYYLCLKDQFGQEDTATELYAELKRAELQ